MRPSGHDRHAPGWLLAGLALGVALSATACAANPSAPATGSMTTSSTTRSAAATSAATAPAPWPRVAFTPVATGFSRPDYVASAGDGSGRLFVVEQTGKIRVLKGGRILPTPFLDLSGRVSGKNEQGLLGLAFAPGYATNGRFYVDYTDVNGDTVVAAYHADPKGDVAEGGSARPILAVKQPYANHNGGCLQFGPDGLLYIGMGDGGGGGDPGHRAQDLKTNLGKILRVGPGGVVSIWQLGLRNPWRFSFDRATGDLYIGDVGQNAWEEIDFAPKGVGSLNYGWNLWEGDHPYPSTAKPSRVGYTFPVAEYPHPDGEAVIGGYVYRGAANPSWTGTYFYADEVTGKLWALRRSDKGAWTGKLLAQTGRTISSFGEDQTGELYVTDLRDGTVYRMDEAE